MTAYYENFLPWEWEERERLELDSYLPGYTDRFNFGLNYENFYYDAINPYYDDLDNYLNQTMEVASPPSPPQSSITAKEEPQTAERKLIKSRRKVSALIKQQYQFSGQRYLLLFALERLSDPNNSDIVWVKQEDGVFEIRSPFKFAREWGEHKETKETKDIKNKKYKKGKKGKKDDKEKKERKEMTYEKMARSFRYYYKCNMITKVPGVRRYKWDMTVLEDLKRCCKKPQN